MQQSERKADSKVALGPKTRIVVAFSLFVCLMLVGYLIFLRLFSEEKEVVSLPELNAVSKVPSSPKEAKSDELPHISVVSVEGDVRRQETDSNWVSVKEGDELPLDQSLRAEKEANAIVDIGKGATVALSPSSEFKVKKVENGVSEVSLERGRLSAVVDGKSGAKLRVGASGSDAVAETEKGEFSMLSDGQGNVSVATQKGRVRLSAKNKSVEITPGMQSIVERDNQPRAPEPIPSTLFLKVVKPHVAVIRKKETKIQGTTVPGAIININKVRVFADTDGKFAGVVPLSEGKNRIVVEAEDTLGRRESISVGNIMVDTRPPKAHSKVKWGKR